MAVQITSSLTRRTQTSAIGEARPGRVAAMALASLALVVGGAGVIGGGGVGCIAEDTTADFSGPPTNEKVGRTIAPHDDNTTHIDFDIKLTTLACSAAIGCSDMLFDPATAEKAPSLVTGFSCGYSNGLPDQDTLLAFHSQITCYDTGNPDIPSTWATPTILAGTAGYHRNFAEVNGFMNNPYYDTARLLAPMATYAVCHFEGWGWITASQLDASDRAPMFGERYPTIHWQAVIEPLGNGQWDCNDDDSPSPNGLTWVQHVAAPVVVHDTPAPIAKGSFPSQQDLMTITDASLVTAWNSQNWQHQGGWLITAGASAFPPRGNDPAQSFSEKSLWLLDGAANAPAGVAVSRSCVEYDLATGEVDVVAVIWRSVATNATYAVSLITKAADGTFDCEREVASGACRQVPSTEWQTRAPCVAAVAAP